MVETDVARDSDSVQLSDRRALTAVVDHEAVRALRDEAPPAERRLRALEIARAVASTIASALAVLMVVIVPASFMPILAFLTDNLSHGVIVAGLIGTAISIGLIFTFGRSRARRVAATWRRVGSWTHRWRMTRFAADNDLVYNARPRTMPSLGSLLHHARPSYTDGFALMRDGRATLFGNALPRRNSTMYSSPAPDGWFFFASKLETAVPHMMLLPNMRVPLLGGQLFNISGAQRLRLEGDFDRHFALYAPQSYERDALYVITPDLMALLIDHLSGAIVETYDDNLVVTVPRPTDFSDPASWSRIADLLDVVMPKTHRQTRRYRDERSSVAGTVAQGGRVLRPGFSVATAISVVVLVVQVLAIAFR